MSASPPDPPLPRARRIERAFRAPGRARHIAVVFEPDGGIRITGEDVGNGVSEGDEYATYAWTWRLEPEHLPAALRALGGTAGQDPYEAIDAWISAERSDPGMAISAAGVPIAFSSRLSD